jgi:hypothetical protein
MNPTLIFSKLGIPASLSQDILLLLVVVGASAIFAMLIGRFRLLAILANIYIALAVLSAVPGEYLTSYLYAVGFFLAIVIVMTVFGKKLFDAYLSGWRVFALSFLEVGLLLSVIVSFLPREIALEYVSKNAYFYLASPLAHLAWVVAPLIFILLIQKRLNR